MPRAYSPPTRIAVIASAAVTTSSSTANLKGTAGAIPMCDAVTLVLDVTAYTGTVSPNVVSIYIDSSPDGGTTWYPSINFAPVTTSTDIQRWEGRTIGVGSNESAALVRIGTTIATASASINNTVLSLDHRVRTVFATGGTTQSVTYAIWAFCTDNGTYGA